MASPEPPVALKDHCSIIHDNTLYVYSPDAFQILPLSENATWTQAENGVSVTGALCVKGGLDGDNNHPTLYIVGGQTNATTTNYSGIQRYSLLNKVWETINPISAVTANRLNHGAAYLNASSAVLIYGGSQNGDAGLSTETFLMLMYPPYRVQAYSSAAPAVTRPFLLPFSEDKAVMVGGGNGNQQVFTFHPDPGWVNLGVTLPTVLPDPSVAQVNLQILDDGTRVLQTYYTNESPNRVTRNVLTDPGFVPAAYGKTIGDSTGGTNSRIFRRQIIQGNYPTYNATNAPEEQRTGASLASNAELIAISGGDSNSSVSVFNSTGNSWVNSKQLFGDNQEILSASSTTSATPTPTASQTRAATSATSSAASSDSGDGQSNGLAILGGVLGGICGFAAILIILLLWLRSVKRRKAAEQAAKNKTNESPYPDDKSRAVSQDGDSTPLSQQAQPMGRSPVPSAVITDRDSAAMFGGRPMEKSLEAGMQTHGPSKLNPNHAANNSIGGFFKSNNRTPLAISKPMAPDLGDYQVRPSIDLGAATPAAAPILPPVGATATSREKADQRKTDEGWAKYFTADKTTTEEKRSTVENLYGVSYEDDPRRSTSRPNTAKGGGTGFWPGSGVPSSNRSTKLPLRDSAGNPLNHATVNTASPSLAVHSANDQTRNLSIVAPAQAKISSADSISTDQSSDDGYEDEDVDMYSESRDSYPTNNWNPAGSTWSGPSQRPLRPPSVRVGASAYPPPTSYSLETSNTSGSGGTSGSSIPQFPLPTATIGRADTTNQYVGTSTVERPPGDTYRPSNPYAHARKSSNTTGGPAVNDYFGPPASSASSAGDSSKIPDSHDMSWLNLGTPAGTHIHGASHVGDARDPA